MLIDFREESAMKRYFEFVDAKSSKFWEVWIEASTMYTRFGKLGANGQTTVKEFPSVEAALSALDKSIAEKLKKGYVESSDRTRTPVGVGVSEKNSPEDAISEDQILSMDSARLDALAAQHPSNNHLFEGCSVCDNYQGREPEFLPWGFLGADIVSAPGVSTETQIAVLEQAMSQQDAGVSKEVIARIVRNPASTSEAIDAVIEYDPIFLVREISKTKKLSESSREWVDGILDEGWKSDVDEDMESEADTPDSSCSVCGTSLTLRAKFCSECGAEQNTAKFCSQCGAKRQGGARFCVECGHPH